MEICSGSSDESIDTQRMDQQLPCAYRDLEDETKAKEFFGQHPEVFEENSPQLEEMLRKPICGRPSCLLNLRIMMSHMLTPGKPEAIADADWAAPPDCEWRNAAGGVRSEP